MQSVRACMYISYNPAEGPPKSRLSINSSMCESKMKCILRVDNAALVCCRCVLKYRII